MIPKRNNQAQGALSVFFEELNDIDVYIEDTAKESKKVFTRILKRIFDKEYKINEVFQLGGYDEVVKKHSEGNKRNRPYLFIVDGDFRVLDHKEEKAGLYQLPFYCIENILISDPEAIVSFLEYEDDVKDKDQIRKELCYNEWLSRMKTCYLIFLLTTLCFTT